MGTTGIDLTREARTDRAERVAMLTRAGRSATDIAFITGMSVRTVERYRRRCGINLGGVCRPRTSGQVLAAAEALLRDGASYREAARTLGVNRETLTKHLPGYGWTRAEVGQYSKLMQQFHRLAAAR